MAELHTWRITFSDANPYGEFVDGDVVDIFYDPDLDPTPTAGSSAGIIVKKNDVQIFSGADIRPPSTTVSYKTEKYSDSSLGIHNLRCNGTSLVGIVRTLFTFPYAVNGVVLADYPTCAATTIVCDLQFVGQPVVVAASGQTSNDGQFTVLASSSNGSIQFKLNNDFAYDDGSGHQATGVFTALFPGTYRVYIRDEVNCGANILVTIPIDNTYGTKYRLDYNVEVDGTHVSNTRIDIQERAFSGSVTEICGADIPFELSLRGEGEEDKFYPILSTNADLRIISRTNFQFIDLFTNDPKKYKVVYQKDFLLGGGYETQWQGFIEPQIYNEDYSPPPYEVSFSATDRIPTLKDYFFSQDDGLQYTGTMKAIVLIAQCLQKTDLQLNIRVGCNMYATGMNTTASDDPLDQAYIDLRRFYLIDEAPTYDFVLQTILEAFGARLILSENRWNIVRVEELKGPYDYREFDYTGTYTSNGTFDPIIERVPPEESGYWWINNDQFMEVRPGFGKINVKYDMGLFPNMLQNGDFSLTSIYNSLFDTYTLALNTFGFQVINNGYNLIQSMDQIDENNVALVLTGDSNTTGEGYIQSVPYNIKMGSSNQIKITVRYKLPIPIVEVPYQKVRVVVQYGIYYLASSGAWTTSANEVIFYVNEFGKYVESEIVAIQPNSSATAGLDLTVRVYHSYLWHYEYDGTTALKARSTTTLPLGVRTEMRAAAGTFYTGESRIYYELEETTDAESLPDIVRPDDYHATTNPVQWIMKQRLFPETSDPVTLRSIDRSFYIDKIQVNFLYNGNDPISVIDLDKQGESNNKLIFSKRLYFGSLIENIVSKPRIGFKLGLFETNTASINLVTQNILSSNLIFGGWFRDSSGNGYVNWTRDGITETRLLHDIWLLMMAAQYNRSHRRLSGGLIGQGYFTFLKTLKETFDSDRLYIPMGGSFNDKQNSFTGEFVELVDITAEGNSSSSFTSGFVIAAFGSSSFN